MSTRDPRSADPSALAKRILEGYQQGFFPMASSEDDSIRFYTSNPRGVLPLDGLHIPSRLARKLKKNPFELRLDCEFRRVMEGCAERASTWISTELVDIYTFLHQRGFAHSVEAWQNGRLVGGLYGVSLGGAFFGESMFARVDDASKACLVHLVDHLNERRYRLLDCQQVTEHTGRFGAIWIPEGEYLEQLERALRVKRRFWP